MPSTVLGLVLFLALLTPGFVFVATREARFPAADRSPLRETAQFASASVACDAVALLLFAAARFAFPTATPDIGLLVETGTEYVKSEYRLVATWAGIFLLVASAIGFAGARWLPALRGEIVRHSAWWAAFLDDRRADPDSTDVYVGLELLDGSFIGGYLLRFSVDVDETEDREITLEGPIDYQAAGRDAPEELENVNVAMISARRIRYMTVTYLPKPQL